MNNSLKQLKGKKLLIIGGAFQHVKIVETAKKLGVITYVIDCNETDKSPAKRIADYAFQIDIFNIDEIVKLCNKHQIDGILSSNLDICQIPYQKVCEVLKRPCYGTSRQYNIFTNKLLFEQVCRDYGLPTIPRYNQQDAENLDDRELPIIVKPAESSSSKGQSICYNKYEISEAVQYAQKTSLNGEVVIEKYMENCTDIGISGYVINGEFHVVRVGDRFLGTNGMERSEILGVFPSRYTELYFSSLHMKVELMLNDLGINNCPVFLQGLVKDDEIKLYDPGLRFSGCEYEKAFEKIYGINLVEFGICISLGHPIPDYFGQFDIRKCDGKKYAVILYIPIKEGIIGKIDGQDKINGNNDIVAFQTQYNVGDYVGMTYTAKQRYCEIDFVADSVKKIQDTVEWIYDTIRIIDINGENMMFSMFDKKNLEIYEE